MDGSKDATGEGRERGQWTCCVRMSREHATNVATNKKSFKKKERKERKNGRVQELCESRGGRAGLSVLISLTISVDVKQR